MDNHIKFWFYKFLYVNLLLWLINGKEKDNIGRLGYIKEKF